MLYMLHTPLRYGYDTCSRITPTQICMASYFPRSTRLRLTIFEIPFISLLISHFYCRSSGAQPNFRGLYVFRALCDSNEERVNENRCQHIPNRQQIQNSTDELSVN